MKYTNLIYIPRGRSKTFQVKFDPQKDPIEELMNYILTNCIDIHESDEAQVWCEDGDKIICQYLVIKEGKWIVSSSRSAPRIN